MTRRPVTAPPLNATRMAAERDCVAAWVVRVFARTAIRIPMYPAAREQKAPIKNPIAVALSGK